MKVLITSGPTQEKIDGVRSITNFSTGSTGARIADCFSGLGAQVYFLHNLYSQIPKNSVEKLLPFSSFSQLDEAIKGVLQAHKVDAVIHLAAVGDYAVDYVMVNGKKFKSSQLDKVDSGEDLHLHLKRTPKIIDSIKSYHPHGDVTLFGFKLTNTDSIQKQQDAINQIIKKPHVDYVVHNDLRSISAEGHIANIYSKAGQVVQTATKNQLASELFKLIRANSSPRGNRK